MENKTITDFRLKLIESRLSEHNEDITKIQEEVKTFTQRSNDRYTEMSKLGTKLEESYKYQYETIQTLITSIDSLIAEMKQTNKIYNEQFINVDRRFNTIEQKFNKEDGKVNEKSISVNKEDVETNEKNLGNTQKGAIVLGIIGLLEVFVRYVAPLFFN